MRRSLVFTLLKAIAAFCVLAGLLLSQVLPPSARQAPAETVPAVSRNLGKTLIIVYSVTGNTLDMAERIQARTGGDIVRIETVEPYPAGGNLIPYAKRERDELRWPELRRPLPDVGGYDTVFLGTPVWFHGLPPATVLFLEAMDFGGKPLAPFLTAGGGPGDSADALRNSARNARIMGHKVITRYASRPGEDIDKEIGLWLAALLAEPLPDPLPDASASPEPDGGGNAAQLPGPDVAVPAP
ncbi:MAG: hypothetical protein LBQ79_05710 [Deltaproteobacteria bacterium]|jgi:flavodoxin|nr:hypothetical protein [Deltaproteobacteria bacterium]